MPTPRKLALLAASIGLCALIALTLLTGADVISATAAVVLGAIAVVLACQILTVMSVRRVDGKAMRIDNRVKRYETEMADVKAVTERLDRRLDEIVELLRSRELKRDEDLQAILISLGEDRLTSLPQRQEMEEMVHELLPRLEAVEARTEAEGKA
jgi:type VI protein secretion system component VasK